MLAHGWIRRSETVISRLWRRQSSVQVRDEIRYFVIHRLYYYDKNEIIRAACIMCDFYNIIPCYTFHYAGVDVASASSAGDFSVEMSQLRKTSVLILRVFSAASLLSINAQCSDVWNEIINCGIVGRYVQCVWMRTLRAAVGAIQCYISVITHTQCVLIHERQYFQLQPLSVSVGDTRRHRYHTAATLV